MEDRGQECVREPDGHVWMGHWACTRWAALEKRWPRLTEWPPSGRAGTLKGGPDKAG